MSWKLDIFSDRYEYIISWIDPDDGEPGLSLGENADDPEHVAASNAAMKLLEPGVQHKKDHALRWETKSGATKALRAARAAVRAHRQGKAWPDWAIQAQANGWSPPRGWTPP
jgi:hypothetical protein